MCSYGENVISTCDGARFFWSLIPPYSNPRGGLNAKCLLLGQGKFEFPARPIYFEGSKKSCERGEILGFFALKFRFWVVEPQGNDSFRN